MNVYVWYDVVSMFVNDVGVSSRRNIFRKRRYSCWDYYDVHCLEIWSI